MRSLDSLLGSRDDEDTQSAVATVERITSSQLAASSQPAAIVSPTKHLRYTMQQRYVYNLNDTIETPKVQPLVTYGIYYLQIAVYAVFLLVSSMQGPEGATDPVEALLANDHIAVAARDEVYRFLTCSFVHEGPLQLFVTLFALVTLSAELESLIGYAAFTAVFLLASMSASVADAIAGDLPVTQGAFPAIAGMVGALIAHEVKNWKFEYLVQDARQPPADKGSQDEVGKVEVLEGLLEFTGTVSREGKAFLALGGTLLAVFQALEDVSNADTFTSWVGLETGLVAGCLLAWFMSPEYDVRRESAEQVQAASGSSQAQGSATPTPAAAAAAGAGAGAGADGAAGRAGAARGGSADRIVVVDKTSNVQRAAVAVGYNVALYAVVQAWLSSSPPV
mmetsp:Transcript_36793/g.81839  ORF Transcript_36793/g.81839 Transcript_36793/m.81839 type:complete len:393 (-) Transcript_36793:107-1285(-)